MYNKLFDIYKIFQKRKYHNMHKNNALKKLQQIESKNGKLSDDLRKKCDDYAQSVLGWKGYAPWLYVYSAMINDFKEGWIPDNYYGEVVVKKLKGDYGKIANLKSLQRALFNSECFPDLFYHVNGLWLSHDYKTVNQEYVLKYLRNNPGKYVYKIYNSQSGKGVYIYDENSVVNIDLGRLESKGNGVFQRYIHQHSFFSDIIASSVATIRLTTVINDLGEVLLRGSYLRVGRSADDKVTSSSGIRIPINLENGDLDEFCYDNSFNRFLAHPDTNFVFKGRQIPNFIEMVEVVSKLHLKVPFTRIVGWDVVVDMNNSIMVMEWNGMHNTIYFDELTKGPIFQGLGYENLWKNN